MKNHIGIFLLLAAFVIGPYGDWSAYAAGHGCPQNEPDRDGDGVPDREDDFPDDPTRFKDEDPFGDNALDNLNPDEFEYYYWRHLINQISHMLNQYIPPGLIPPSSGQGGGSSGNQGGGSGSGGGSGNYGLPSNAPPAMMMAPGPFGGLPPLPPIDNWQEYRQFMEDWYRGKRGPNGLDNWLDYWRQNFPPNPTPRPDPGPSDGNGPVRKPDQPKGGPAPRGVTPGTPKTSEGEGSEQAPQDDKAGGKETDPSAEGASNGGNKEEKPQNPQNENEKNPKQDKRLSKRDLARLEQMGYDAEEIKGGTGTGKLDLYKRDGEVIIKPKDGSGPGERTGIYLY